MSLHNIKARTGFVLFSILGTLASTAWAQPLVSNFDSSIEGWTVETHGHPAGSFTLFGTFVPVFIPTGGQPGGYITAIDPDSNWSFFRAPLSWSGDRSSLEGGWLHYFTRTDSNSFPDGRLVILVGNDGQSISSDQGVPELDTWTHRRIGLNNENNEWFVGTFASGAPASGTEINAVLADLEALFIGFEFGSNTAEEQVDLDSVRMSDCKADLNGDGSLDFFDVSLFLAEQVNFDSDPMFDFFDISLFLSAFAAGCP